jgi:hypothetical protein
MDLLQPPAPMGGGDCTLLFTLPFVVTDTAKARDGWGIWSDFCLVRLYFPKISTSIYLIPVPLLTEAL